jgi:TIR domain
MAQIFISYRRGPTGYVATLLADEIKARFGPKAVFMDIDNIPLGVDFRDHIGAAVSECQVLLALIGDDWLSSKLPDGVRRIDASDDFVRVEIEAALQRGIPVVPILTNNANVPAESELPESLRPLAFRNAAELRSGRDLKGQMEALIRQLSWLSSSKKISSATGDRSIRAPAFSALWGWSKRRLSLGMACLIVAVVAATVVLLTQLIRNKGSTGQQHQTGVREVTLQTADDAPIPLYKNPDQHSATSGSLLRGSKVVVVDTFRGADGRMWSKISIDRGWMAAINFAQPEFAMLRPTNTATLQAGQPAVVSYTGADGLNLRESPNPQSSVIAILCAQTQVMVINDKLTTKDYEWWGVEVPPAYILTDSVSMQ